MKAVKTYDVIIIGAGPAGIFTALELADKGLDILIVEKRPGYTGSDCDQSQSRCQTGRPGPQCRLRLGWRRRLQ